MFLYFRVSCWVEASVTVGLRVIDQDSSLNITYLPVGMENIKTPQMGMALCFLGMHGLLFLHQIKIL